jgi:hypothetical protein
LPDAMWKRKPMSGGAESYPDSAKPVHKVYGAADSQDVAKVPVKRVWRETMRRIG